MDKAELRKRVQAFVETTVELSRDGVGSGITPGSVAQLIIAVGVGLHMKDRGVLPTIELLCKQAAELARPKGRRRG